MNAPENALEAAALKARDDRLARPAFYGELMHAELVAIGRMSPLARGGVLDLAVARRNGCNYHLIFSSLKRKHAFLGETSKHVVVGGRSLFESTRGARFVLNPGWVCGTELAPNEIAYWLGGPLEHGPDALRLRRPEPYPAKLTKALSVLFVNRRVRAAHLVEARTAGEIEPPQILVGVDAECDWQTLKLEIAAAVVVADAHVSAKALHLGHDQSPLARRLLEVPPFFVRSEFNQ